MGTHRVDRRGTALMVLTLLGLAACSAGDRAPVLQSTVTQEATDDDDASVDEPLTFIAPDRSSNADFGLSADGPERTDVHGTYRQAAFADDAVVFEFSPDVVSPDLEPVFSADEIAAAQRTAVTFLVREYIDSELVADDTDATRAVVEERLRGELAAGDFWDTELPSALAEIDCTYLVDCRSTSRDPALGRTLESGSELRFILTDFVTTDLYLSEDDAIVVGLSAAYRRELDVPGKDHMLESTTVDATYAFTTDGSAWFLDGWDVEADSMDVGALVDGGEEALPILDDVDWGTVPAGFTDQTFEGTDYALGPGWEPGGDEMWAWYRAGGDIVYESFVGPVLDATGERADFAVTTMPKPPGESGGLSESEWVYPLDGASYRVEVPGADAAAGEFKPVSYDDRERVDIWVETDDAYLWFVMYADQGDGETALRELVQTITVR